MPIYMDVHYVPGLAAIDAAEAHQKDLAIQHQHHCKCMTYWVDEPRGVVFCLIEAPDKQTVEEMHKNSHGLIPHKILEVSNGIVESFLGRIHDPQDALVAENGLKVFSDPAYRVLVIAGRPDHILLRHKIGSQEADKLLSAQDAALRRGSAAHGGRIVEQSNNKCIVSFSSASAAVACGLELRQLHSDGDDQIADLSISITGGNPVASGDQLFGDAVQLGTRLCQLKRQGALLLSTGVKDLLPRDICREHESRLFVLSSKDETMMECLWDILEKHGQEADFGVESFGRLAA